MNNKYKYKTEVLKANPFLMGTKLNFLRCYIIGFEIFLKDRLIDVIFTILFLMIGFISWDALSFWGIISSALWVAFLIVKNTSNYHLIKNSNNKLI